MANVISDFKPVSVREPDSVYANKLINEAFKNETI